jgi:N-sulfoglucosamine sulfohydrolase
MKLRATIITALLLSCLAALHAADTLKPPARPNILLITADDMHWDSVGAYGCPVAATTPNIDRLAAEGFRFHYAFVPISLCTPSRQVMLSGNHSHQTQTREFTELERVGPALPDLLKQNGYYLANLNKQQDYYEWDTAITEDQSGFGRDVPFFKKAVGEIIATAKRQNQPWFIMANSNDPHRPFYDSAAELGNAQIKQFREQGRLTRASREYRPEEVVVPGFLPDLPEVRGEFAEYYTSVRRCDDSVGGVLAALAESGQATNTIVVFLSDNGISMPFAKLNCYQASLRVPLIVRWAGQMAAGKRDPLNLVSTVDLAPTLLELAGLPVPAYMAGRSFVPLLNGETQTNRDFIVGYYYNNLRQIQMYPEFTIQTRDWTYIYNPWVDGKKEVHNSDYTGSPTLLAMWKAAETVPSVRARVDFHKYRVMEELYDVRQDPYAYMNVASAPENAERVKAMRQRLLAWMQETKHPAAKLMADPFNRELIAEYMAWEKANAAKQIEEVDRLKKEHRVRPQPSAMPARQTK